MELGSQLVRFGRKWSQSVNDKVGTQNGVSLRTDKVWHKMESVVQLIRCRLKTHQLLSIEFSAKVEDR
jgi:hypothetical protein